MWGCDEGGGVKRVGDRGVTRVGCDKGESVTRVRV